MSTEKKADIRILAECQIRDLKATGIYEKNSGWLLISFKEIPLKDVVPLEIADFIPEIEVKDITVGYRKNQTNESEYFFRTALGASINLSNLPLVGKQLPAEQTLGIDKLSLVVRGGGSSETQLAIEADINFGGKKSADSPFSLPVTRAKAPSSKTAGSPAPVKNPGTAAAVEQPGITKWINVEKAFGPIAFKRIGGRYHNAKLHFLLDADLVIGPLTVSMMGLSVGSPLDKFKPEFNLDGLGLSYAKDPVQISGAFLRDKTDNSYQGTALIKVPKFTLYALGAYQEINGSPSIFIYAVYHLTVGVGPAFFQVTGIAAGFGYNRALKIPPIDEMHNFPLVKTAMAGAADETDPLTVLGNIKQYIPPAAGELFFALGLKFNSFRLIDSFALLILRLGRKVRLDMLGISRLTVPPPKPGGSATVHPLAQVELVYKVFYDFDEGALKVEGRLTPASFIFSQSCRLSGGFAFYSWFSGSHAGDFVLTAGGYHPEFKVPAHYPKVPRLTFHWQMYPYISLKGYMYFALVPGTLMAGGQLKAVFELSTSVGFDIGIAGASLSGTIRACFTIGGDFLIAWKPFYYRADLYVSISVRATFKGKVKFLFITKTVQKSFNLSLGAGLSIRGPEFSGTARVNWNIVSFDVKFGSQPTPPPVLTWPEFKQAFLPKKNTDICTLAVEDGIVKQLNDNHIVVNPSELVLSASSVIPLRTVEVSKKNNLTSSSPFGITPMKVSEVKYSRQIVKILKSDDGGAADVTDEFVFEPVLKQAPAALWGTSSETKLNDANALVSDMLMGFGIRPKPKRKPDTTESKQVSDFKYDVESKADAYRWNTGFSLSTDDADDTARRNKVKQISQKSANTNRNRILAGLGLDPGKVSLTGLAGDTTDDFLAAPEVVSLSHN